jgi:hypothetical protein
MEFLLNMIKKLCCVLFCYSSSFYSFRPHYGPGVDSASNRNEYQEYFLGVKAAGA